MRSQASIDVGDQLFRLMAEGVRDAAICLLNPTGEITHWLAAGTRMLGYRTEEAVGQPLDLIFTEADQRRGRARQDMELAMRRGAYSHRGWLRRKDGSQFLGNVELVALRSAQGPLLGFAKIVRDLSAQERLLERLRASRGEIDRILSVAGAATWRWNPATNGVRAARLRQLLGYRRGGPRWGFDDWLDIVHPEDRENIRRELGASLTRRSRLLTLVRLRDAEGEYRWLYGCADWQPAADPKSRILAGVVVDVSERQRAEAALAAERERARVTLISLADGVISADRRCRVSYLNPAAERMTGWPLAEALGRPLEEVFRVVDKTTGEPLPAPGLRCLREGRVVDSGPHALLLSRDGHRRSIEDSVSPIRLDDDQVDGVVTVFHDITETRRLIDRLSYEASHDALTGLVNRAAFEERLERVVSRGGALLYLDLDRFKVVNDTCGHAAGDELLRQLARTYQQDLRERDTLARLGGDEFALLLEHASLEEAVAVAEKLRRATLDFRFVRGGHAFQIGVSVGLAPLVPGIDAEEALQRADRACYIAKASGRNRVYVYRDDEEPAQRRQQLYWEIRLRRALEEDALQLYYQPMVPFGGRRELSYEVLLRLPDPEGAVAPGSFLSAAERHGLMPALDRWVLRTTLDWLRAHPGRVERCGINLSGHTLADDHFLDDAVALLGRAPAAAACLRFELSERAAVADPDRVMRLIEGLRAWGCGFALDNFGTGLGSFAQLKRLPVDMIKIDGAFIAAMTDSDADCEIVSSVNAISHRLGKLTVAERVDSRQAWQRLGELGVDYAQGYWLAAPRPLA